ncbi:MAG: CvpA family protein [Muribaculaceae bacterium]|nr:CvpA family protein [Bacteroides sp.]MDE5847941.1 CvpA family protein [Muribaculaceae bacterium]MDE6194930.1 CvpA family protein [Muribaculaceae bacterium]
MGEAIYHILVIVVALVGMIRGFNAGLLRQASSVLGFVFGIVAARAVGPDFAIWLAGWFPAVYHPVAKSFFVSILGYGIIWGLSMFAFSMFAGILNLMLGLIPTGIMNSIAGAAFSLLKSLMFLSILFDFAICRPFDSPLMHCARHDDGNLVDGVIRLAPELLGTMSVEEYAHRVQLWEARTIS